MSDAARAILEPVLAAHGGADRWAGLSSLMIEYSAGGALFAMKQRPRQDHARVWLSTTAPHARFFDFPRPGHTGEWQGDQEVRILGPGGSAGRERRRPRDAFRGLRRQLRWDDLDFLYFGGYALWNYLTTPWLLARADVELEALPPAEGPGGRCQRLRATFPASIPTHSRVQTFWFDGEHRLRRHDYTADVVGTWARGAHMCDDHRMFHDLLFPTRRAVTPRLGRRVIPGPTLVALDIHTVVPA